MPAPAHLVTRREPAGMPSTRSALPAWQKLVEHRRAASGLRLRDLFAGDTARFRKFSLAADGILFDYS